MFKQFIIVLLSLASLQNGIDCSVLKDVSPWNPFLERVDATCTEAGLMCRNCKQVIFCIEDINGGFNELEMQTCELNQTCLNGECTAEPNSGCDGGANIAFPCNNKGMFPDPFNCKKYHICCNIGKSDENICDKDHAYDPLSTYCKTRLEHNTCTKTPIPTCTKAGQVGPVAQNPSIYFICQLKTTTNNKKVLYPMQFLCPNGKEFVGNHCVDKPEENYYI